MRHRHVSLYVEWANRKDIREICTFLISNGARNLYVDEDMDQQYIPGQSFLHAHTVFRFRINQTIPEHELLSALAMHPGVYSAGEIIRAYSL